MGEKNGQVALPLAYRSRLDMGGDSSKGSPMYPPQNSHASVKLRKRDVPKAAYKQTRESTVGLHPNHCDISWVPHGGSDATGYESCRDLTRQRHIFGVEICPFLLQNVVQSHSGGGVEGLAEDGGRNARKESGNTVLLNNPDPNINGSHTGWRPRELDVVVGMVGRGGKSKNRTKVLNRRIWCRRFSLELHPDLNQIKWVCATPCNNQSNASFNKSHQTHYQKIRLEKVKNKRQKPISLA
ncbi:Uncharacterized protein Fot_02158 [Forsythia ovata]|uniref:Uncharacterized protein n=1 Tax=Forsythia ovata TaxID=205694 RepID=A0ABD1X692_9LAMI